MHILIFYDFKYFNHRLLRKFLKITGLYKPLYRLFLLLKK